MTRKRHDPPAAQGEKESSPHRVGVPLTIGIAGPSASGKTALALRLVELLPGCSPVRVPLDHYYRDLAELAPELRESRNFDHPGALDHELLLRQLRTLAAGEPIDMPVYRFATHSRAPRGRRLGPGRILVVDGLYCLFWPELRDLLDVKVFVDAEPGVCLARRIERDTTERGRTEASVREQVASTVRPMYRRYVLPTRAFADVVLRGEDPVEANARAILRYATSAGGALATFAVAGKRKDPRAE